MTTHTLTSLKELEGTLTDAYSLTYPDEPLHLLPAYLLHWRWVQYQDELRAERRETLRAKAKVSIREKEAHWSKPSRYASSYWHEREAYKHLAQYFKAILEEDKKPEENREIALYMEANSLGPRLVSRLRSESPTFDKFVMAINQANERFDTSHWTLPIWGYTYAMPVHFVHVSKDDPAKVAFYKNLRDLLADRLTRTTPGRYLKRIVPEISEDEVRNWSQKHQQKFVPPTLHLVGVDNPDGWEWVYEHSSGFTSCMMYNHPDRYIDHPLYGKYHPVRSYCHPDSPLKLAYIGDPVGTKDGKVYARSIVLIDSECEPVGYVRVYGDDRLVNVLSAAGFDSRCDLNNIPMLWREHPDRENAIILPYLDSGNYFIDVYREQVRIHECDDYGSSSSGWMYARATETCSYCEDAVLEGDLTSTYDNQQVCAFCLESDYTYAYVPGGEEYVHNDSIIFCESDRKYYLDKGFFPENLDVYRCEESGKYWHIDDLTYTSRGYLHCDYCVELDHEDEDGNIFAHQDDVVEDFFTDEKYHEDDSNLLEFESIYFTEDSLRDNLDIFSVVGNTLLRESKPERGAMSLREWLLATRTYETPTNARYLSNALDTIRDELLNEEDDDEDVTPLQLAA